MSKTFFFTIDDSQIITNVSIQELPAAVSLWLGNVAIIFTSEAFRFIRFKYPDYRIEVRRIEGSRYTFKCCFEKL